jgi:hypothetical protein
MRAILAATEYLRREQALGRVNRWVAPEAAARLVLGTCFAHVILVELVGDGGHMIDDAGRILDDKRYTAELVSVVWKGIAPPRRARTSG